MPLYDFRCPTCEQRFEELQSHAAPPPACPACGGAAAERLLSAFQRPGTRGGPDPAWTPAATRGCAAGCRHHHH